MTDNEQTPNLTNGIEHANQNDTSNISVSRLPDESTATSSNGGVNQLTKHSPGHSNFSPRRAPAAPSQFFNNNQHYGDSVSMTSKTSRSSRFVRRFSLGRGKASAWLASKLHKHQRSNDISASFNLLDQENKEVLVNLNTATEEELMTVRGVTRAIAQSIVEYRSIIGSFKTLQDLALVSGIGASKLALFCKDFTVGDADQEQSSDEDLLTHSGSPPSVASAPSPQPWPSDSSTPYHSTGPKPLVQSFSSPLQCVNINTATIFEMMTVPGINQEMAANILHYRERKGPFRSVDELSKVRGMRLKVTRHIRPHLTTDSSLNSKAQMVPTPKLNAHLNANGKGHRRTLSAPQQGETNGIYQSALAATFIEEEANEVPLRGGEQNELTVPVQSSAHRLSIDFSSDVYALLSLRSQRPEVSHHFDNKLNGRRAIRIATWNLSKLTSDKINNPGVLEVICRTILERNFTVVAVQDILGADLLKYISKELNEGNLRRVREWGGSRGNWDYVESAEPVSQYTHSKKLCKTYEYGGFLFNKKHVNLLEAKVIKFDSLLHHVSKPLVAQFKSNETKLIIGSFHLKASNFIYLNDLSSCQSLHNEEPFLSALDINLSETESLDSIKKNKNLQNGLIRESRVREELPLNGLKGTRRVPSTSDSVGMVDELKKVVEVFRECITEEDKNVVICGDFGNFFKDDCYEAALSDYKPLLDTEVATDVTSNFCVSASMIGLCADQCYPVKEGLSHLAIPCGWGWGGSVSTQCPVYVDACVEPSG